MNYDEFRDYYDMEFHGKVYDVVLNICQYRDKVTKASCIKAEVYDDESEGLRTIYGSCIEFKFKKKRFEIKKCGSCIYFNGRMCLKTGLNTCEENIQCDKFKDHI